jgi:hypothetical protein
LKPKERPVHTKRNLKFEKAVWDLMGIGSKKIKAKKDPLLF